MRISSIRIGSFGELRDRRLDPGHNLTLIYGKNETGKTTIMEFTRSAMFPDNQRKHYPEYRSTDQGELDYEVCSGERFTIFREGKKVRSDHMPSESVHMEPQLYRSLFAMSPDDLRDSKVISSGDIKNRFLTIPGGDLLPKTIDDIDSEMKEIMSADRKSSSTRISKLMSEIEDNNREITLFKEKDNQYYQKVSERNDLLRAFESLKDEKSKNDAELVRYKVQSSQNENISRLEGLKAKKEGLSASAIISDGDIGRYDQLKRDLKAAIRQADDSRSDYEGCKDSTEGIDHAQLLAHRSTIEDLKQKEQYYSQISRQKQEFMSNEEKARNDANRKVIQGDDSNSKDFDKRPMSLGILGLIVFTIVGILSNILVSLIGVAILVVSIWFSFNGRTKKEDPKANAVDNTQAEYWHDKAVATDKEISEMDRTLNNLSKRLGLERSSFIMDVDHIYSLLGNAMGVSRALENKERSEISESKAQSDLNLFISKFGSEERFMELCKMKKEYDSVCGQIKVLEESIRSSGYVSDSPMVEIKDGAEIQGRIEEIQRKIGDIDRQITSIREDNQMERLLDMRTILTTDLYNAVKRWAVLSMARSMIEDACASIYSDVQPGVICTADGLVRAMTCGRYGLEMDIRTNEVKVVSGTTGKKEGEWSTGLGDQVYLSIKLAIAKEMSREEPLPIMLDDVLLMFDSDRKKTACDALIGLSNEMQILFFTCDAETLSIMRDRNACKIVEIS